MKKVAIIAAALLFVAAFVHAQQATVSYAVAMSAGGWSAFVQNGAEGGTSGRRQQAQAIRVRLASELPGTIKFRVHSGGKWSDWKYHNEIAGDVGASSVEAIQVELTGELDDRFDVQYTVFQNNAWTGWISNGDTAGVTGQRRYVEAIQIVLTENKAGRRPQGGKRAAPPPPPAPPGQGGGRR